jgi:hypothetical protein
VMNRSRVGREKGWRKAPLTATTVLL